MTKDPAIDEIREVRREISRDYETTEDFLDHYRSLEKALAPRMLRAVSAEKKKTGTAEQTADQVR
jgi:HEPN domain-containing protein